MKNLIGYEWTIDRDPEKDMASMLAKGDRILFFAAQLNNSLAGHRFGHVCTTNSVRAGALTARSVNWQYQNQTVDGIWYECLRADVQLSEPDGPDHTHHFIHLLPAHDANGKSELRGYILDAVWAGKGLDAIIKYLANTNHDGTYHSGG